MDMLVNFLRGIATFISLESLLSLIFFIFLVCFIFGPYRKQIYTVLNNFNINNVVIIFSEIDNIQIWGLCILITSINIGYTLFSFVLDFEPLTKTIVHTSLALYSFITTLIFLLGFPFIACLTGSREFIRQIKSTSMASLYNISMFKQILGEKRKIDYKCVKCARSIQILGRFKCRAGHIPLTDRYIFENCHQCDDTHEYLRCEFCGYEIPLYEDIYNQEEIDNRGNDYISRPPIYMNKMNYYICWLVYSIFILSCHTYYFYTEKYLNSLKKTLNFNLYVNTDIYLYTSKMQLVCDCIIIGGGLLIMAVIYCLLPKKEIVMVNPYTK